MQIIHPQGMYNQLPPEDVFFIMDDMGGEMGVGSIVYQYKPHTFPDCPINLYFSMECQPAARYMLLGALLARARQLRDSNPTVRARVYTRLEPADTRALEFYKHSDIDCTDTEDRLQLAIPFGDGRIPMSCSVRPTPLNTPEEQAALLYRLQMNDLGFITAEYLSQMMRQPHFNVLGLYRNGILVGECIMAGYGESCELAGIYVVQGCRRQGMGKALLHRSMALMAAEGVTRVTCFIMSRSTPQKRLAAAFNAQVLGVRSIFPGIDL